jgi:hypothetical protein
LNAFYNFIIYRCSLNYGDRYRYGKMSSASLVSFLVLACFESARYGSGRGVAGCEEKADRNNAPCGNLMAEHTGESAV